LGLIAMRDESLLNIAGARVRRTVAALVRTRVLRMSNERAIVSFSFDDFPKSVLRAADILSSTGVAGTFFLCSAFCGRTIDEVQYCDLGNIQFLLDNKHELGCHTFSHIRVSRCARDELITDLDKNAEFVRMNLDGAHLSTFSFPFGDMSLSSKSIVQRRFDACRSSLPGVNRGFADLGALRAIRLYSQLIDPEGIKNLIGREARNGAWLIFYTHDVEENPSAFGCTPELFEAAVRAALAAGAQILPIRDALDVISAA
jgi:peptidoglycan/xylan/chitin deacetylase (PgdA/CDA1 family)